MVTQHHREHKGAGHPVPQGTQQHPLILAKPTSQHVLVHIWAPLHYNTIYVYTLQLQVLLQAVSEECWSHLEKKKNGQKKQR